MELIAPVALRQKRHCGLAYPINEKISLESKMQFNITSNDFFEDDYYFSWEMISLRFRF